MYSVLFYGKIVIGVPINYFSVKQIRNVFYGKTANKVTDNFTGSILKYIGVEPSVVPTKIICISPPIIGTAPPACPVFNDKKSPEVTCTNTQLLITIELAAATIAAIGTPSTENDGVFTTGTDRNSWNTWRAM